jgi:DNA-binding beta-propeller fold protein YncE
MPMLHGQEDSGVSTLLASGTASSTLSLDQTRLFVARRDGMLEIRSTANGAVLGSVDLGTGLAAITLSDDGSYLLVTRAGRSVMKTSARICWFRSTTTAMLTRKCSSFLLARAGNHLPQPASCSEPGRCR